MVERPGQEPVRRRRIEIVHESLLTRWPRLVRWQTQDADGAQLRDELRQAAQLWDQHGRSEAYLWTGTALREYQLWRERYPGGLTASEEAFADAMTALATKRRRRRNTAVAALVGLLMLGVATFAALWQRGETARRAAEASRLLAFGQLNLGANPTASLAYAIKSLELADSEEARLFVLKALAAGSPARVVTLPAGDTGPMAFRVAFSPDGAWAALPGWDTLQVLSRDGRTRLSLEPFASGSGTVDAAFDAAGEHLYAAKDGLVRVWSVPRFELVETQTLGGARTWLWSGRGGVLASTQLGDDHPERIFMALAPGSQPRPIGRMELESVEDWDIDPGREQLAVARDGGLYVRSLLDQGEPPRRIAAYQGRPWLLFHPEGDRVGLHDDASGEIRIWSTEADGRGPTRALATPLGTFTFDPVGRRLAAFGEASEGLRVDVWDLDAPPSATVTSFPAPFGAYLTDASFSPDGRWLATSNRKVVCFWALRREPRIFLGHQADVMSLAFTPDGKRLLTVDSDREVREWALAPDGGSRTLFRGAGAFGLAGMDRSGRLLVVGGQGGVVVVPLDGGEAWALEGFDPATRVFAVAIDSEGRSVAAAALRGPAEDKVIRVWDLETGAVRILGPTEQAGEGFEGHISALAFLPDGSLLSGGHGGLRLWSVRSGSHEVVAPSFELSDLAVFEDGVHVAHTVGTDVSRVLAITNLETKLTRTLPSHGQGVHFAAVDRSGTVVVSSSQDGVVRVGPVSGEEPHLLFGHTGLLGSVAVSPDGRWIASGGKDRTVRLWPMPELSRPPLHTLPYLELLAKLRSLTNLRVVERTDAGSALVLVADTAAPPDYQLDVGPFPGWEEVPEW